MSKRENCNVPKIRFRGFNKMWVDKTLGEMGSVAMNKRVFKHQTSTTGDVPFYKIGTFGGKPDSHISRDLFEDYRNRYPYPVQGDLLISASGSIGRVVEYLGMDEYFQDSNIVWLKHDGAVSNLFLRQFYSFVRWSGLEGSTIKRLYNKNILETKINLPERPEQELIGKYFKELDQLIQLHQSKHDKLVALKKAMFQKMFPQSGATTPEIRFKGFSEEWLEKTLGELMPITSAARVHKNEWTCSGVPFFRTSDVVSLYKGEKNEMAFISLDLYEKLSDKIGRIKCGDILITGGGSIGIPFLAKSDDPLYFKDADLLWLKVPKSIDSNYLYTFFSSDLFREYVGSISHIGTIGHYTIEQAKKTPITIPLQAEQKKIGTYFRQLDELISRHATQLEKLKQVKAAFLEKMFV